MPVDAHRQTRILFGPAYYLLESTYLVTAASGIQPWTTSTTRTSASSASPTPPPSAPATRTLRHTTPVAIRGVDDAIDMIRDNRADALALSRDSLNQILPTIPGARITPGGFQHTTISIAVPPTRPQALPIVTTFLEQAKAKRPHPPSLRQPSAYNPKTWPPDLPPSLKGGAGGGSTRQDQAST